MGIIEAFNTVLLVSSLSSIDHMHLKAVFQVRIIFSVFSNSLVHRFTRCLIGNSCLAFGGNAFVFSPESQVEIKQIE